MPPWAPENVAKMTPAARQDLEHSMRAKQLLFIKQRDEAAASRAQHTPLHITLEEQLTEPRDDLASSQDQQSPRKPRPTNSSASTAAEQNQPDGTSSESSDSTVASRTTEKCIQPSLAQEQPHTSIAPQRESPVEETPNATPQSPVDRTNRDDALPESDIDSFHTADSVDLPTSSLDQQLRFASAVDFEFLPNVPTQNAQEPTQNLEPHLKSEIMSDSNMEETTHDQQTQIRQTDRSKSAHSPSNMQTSEQASVSQQTELQPHATSGPPVDSKLPLASITTTFTEVSLDDDSPSPPHLTVAADDALYIPTVSMSSESLEDSVHARRKQLRRHMSAHRQNSYDGFQYAPTTNEIASPVTEVALDQSAASAPKCEECAALRVRIEELELTVQALRSALSARNVERSPARTPTKKSTRSDVNRLMQECESLRFTVDFLVSGCLRFQTFWWRAEIIE